MNGFERYQQKIDAEYHAERKANDRMVWIVGGCLFAVGAALLGFGFWYLQGLQL